MVNFYKISPLESKLRVKVGIKNLKKFPADLWLQIVDDFEKFGFIFRTNVHLGIQKIYHIKVTTIPQGEKCKL